MVEQLQLGLELAIVGMLVVFVVLSVLGGLIAVMNRWADRYEPVAAPAAPGPSVVPGEVDAKTLAVLAAAAAAVVRRPMRIERVQVHGDASI